MRDDTFDLGALDTANLTAPGVYRDAEGRLHAVSLVGLRSGRISTQPLQSVASVMLPQGRAVTQGLELWSILLALAGALWLAGWSLASLRD